LSQVQHWVKKYFTSAGVCECLTSTVTVKLTRQIKVNFLVYSTLEDEGTVIYDAEMIEDVYMKLKF